MINVNKAVVVGRLSNDIELRKTQSNTSVVAFNVAVDEGFGDNKTSNFIPCTAWSKTADFMANYAKKGDMLSVVGRLKTSTYEGKNGKVYKTELVCEDVGLVSKERKQATQAPTPTPQPTFEEQTPLGVDASDLPWF